MRILSVLLAFAVLCVGTAVHALPKSPVAPGSSLRYRAVTSATAPWDDGRQTQLTFVHLSDTHVGRAADAQAFARAIEAINALDPAPTFVLITGDLTDTFRGWEVRKFKELTERLDMPTFIVPGNHDVSFKPNARRIANWKKKFPAFETPYRRDMGPLTLIGVDSQVFNARRGAPAAALARAEYAKLERLLSAARAERRRIMVFHHIPAVPYFTTSEIKRMWDSTLMSDYRALLDRYGVEAELTGHFHRDELYVSGRTLILNAPPISEKFDRKASYRLVRVTAGGLGYRQIYIDADAAHLSYELDLHGVDEAKYREWAATLPAEEMRAVWHYRYAGDPTTREAWRRLDVERFRAYLLDPFAHQPLHGRVQHYAHSR
jgi:3',5'-cyclic-AMP phosphodiesterase